MARRSRSRPTMADVAAHAGVSKMTVSRVLNDGDGVAEETEARVRKAVQELNYVRSHKARSLAVGQSQVLGMIVLDISSEWIWPLVRGAGQEAEAHGYQILLRTTGAGDVASFDVHRPPFGSDLLDGMVVVSWLVPLSYSEELARRHFPVLLVDPYQRPEGACWVSTEDFDGARRAVQHLTEMGHERIAFVGGGREPLLARERQRGFEAAVEAAGFSAQAATVVHGDFTRDTGHEIGLELLAGADRPSAVFAANDMMAIGVLQAAQVLGLRVPEDLSLVGFDDIASARHAQPPLTTVARPYERMGAEAARSLIEMISEPAGPRAERRVSLPTELRVRESTAPPG